MPLKLTLTIVTKILSYLMIFVYAAYVVNKDTPNTGGTLSDFVIPPTVLCIFALILHFSVKQDESGFRPIRRLAKSSLIMSIFTVLLAVLAYHDGSLIHYDHWATSGMPDRPRDAGIYPMLMLFCGLSLSSLPALFVTKSEL